MILSQEKVTTQQVGEGRIQLDKLFTGPPTALPESSKSDWQTVKTVPEDPVPATIERNQSRPSNIKSGYVSAQLVTVNKLSMLLGVYLKMAGVYNSMYI